MKQLDAPVKVGNLSADELLELQGRLVLAKRIRRAETKARRKLAHQQKLITLARSERMSFSLRVIERHGLPRDGRYYQLDPESGVISLVGTEDGAIPEGVSWTEGAP